jgi:putative membrane protein
MKYLLLAFGLFLVSCSKQNSNYSSDSTSTTVNRDSMAAANNPNTTTAANNNAPAVTQMSDANIIAELSEADSAEITEAKYVMSHSKNAQVKSFASMMIADHSKMMKEKQQLASKLKIAPAPPANDNVPSTMQSEMSALQGASNPQAMDSLYVATAVQDHQNDLNEVKDMETKAQSPELKDALQKAEPVIQKHLDHAKMMSDKMSNMPMAKNTH